MRTWRDHILAPVLAAAALAAAGCEHPARSVSPGVVVHPSFWVGCNAGAKYTGGGRVDPPGVGKVTFGFNVQDPMCSGNIKGQLQVVYHVTQTLIHSLTIDKFSSFPDSAGGSCGEFSGTARQKDVFAGTGWTDITYQATVCDNGEPGVGHDTFTLWVSDAGDGTHNNVVNAVLDGGNIQAHLK